MNVAFIGIGVMGSGMAANLLKAGHTVRVYTRTREKAQGVLAQGAAGVRREGLGVAGRAVRGSGCGGAAWGR